MNAIHVTLLFAGILALIQCGLTALVIARRLKAKVSLLDGGDAPLTGRMRAHGNFTETVPICLIMMALLETRGLPSAWLWVIGIGLTFGRLLRAFSLITQTFRLYRLIGMTLTIFAISGLAALCIGLFLSSSS
jgi:uncharacterized protein